MNPKNLLSIIILDIIVMALALGLVIFRYSSVVATLPSDIAPAGMRTAPVPDPSSGVPLSPLTPAHDTASAPSGDQNRGEPSASAPRNIGFLFRHSKARKVEVIGDFNGWAPKPMIKGKDHSWTLTLPIPPGDYAYNFVVDGKPIRDPNNPKTCDVGRGFPNSLLKVRSLTDEKEPSN